MPVKKIPQTRRELMQHLREQCEFIRTSAELFDHGTASEAKRIATAVRTLVHDTGTSTSLLTQLGVKESLEFHSIAYAYKPWNHLMYHGLVGIRLSDPAAFFPHLDRLTPILMTFECWWLQPVMSDRGKQHLFNRRDLVLALANKDGGAHVDPKLDEVYVRLTRDCDFGMTISVGGRDVAWQDPFLPSVRQIGHELLRTFVSLETEAAKERA